MTATITASALSVARPEVAVINGAWTDGYGDINARSVRKSSRFKAAPHAVPATSPFAPDRLIRPAGRIPPCPGSGAMRPRRGWPARETRVRGRARRLRRRRAAGRRRLRRRGHQHARPPRAQRPAGCALPTLGALGLGLDPPAARRRRRASPPSLHGRLHALGPGKDSTAGHWELMGVVDADARCRPIRTGSPTR